MQDKSKQEPPPPPDKKEEEKEKPEILHIGSGGAFAESEGDLVDEQDQAPRKPETPY